MIKRKTLNDILKTLIFLGIGGLLIWLVVRNLSPQDKLEIMNAIKQSNIWAIILVLLIGTMSNISRTIRWQIMIEPLGHKPSFKNTFMAVWVGYLANLAVPRLGEVSRCGVINRYEKLPVESVLGTVVVERIIDTLLLLVVCVVTLVWQFNILSDKLYEFYNSYASNESDNSVGTLKIIVLVSMAGVIILLWVFRNRIKNSNLVIKLIDLFKGFTKGIKTITQLKKPFWFIFHSIFIWVCYFFGTYAGFWALQETSVLGAGATFAILFFGTFAFILVQGGIGAYQIIVQNTLLLYGISSNIGYALGWIIWSSQTLGIILGGFISLLLLPLLNKNNHGLSASTKK